MQTIFIFLFLDFSLIFLISVKVELIDYFGSNHNKNIYVDLWICVYYIIIYNMPKTQTIRKLSTYKIKSRVQCKIYFTISSNTKCFPIEKWYNPTHVFGFILFFFCVKWKQISKKNTQILCKIIYCRIILFWIFRFIFFVL